MGKFPLVSYYLDNFLKPCCQLMINLSHNDTNQKIEKKILECETMNVINIPKGNKLH
jgi:hypothetical protein